MTKKTPKTWLLVLTVSLGTLLNPLNSSMISVALTRIQQEFSLSFADTTWLISIFFLASAAGQPVMGKLSDMFGPKLLFLIGLALVSISCSLAPLSPNYGFLLSCRGLQAIGSSTLFPSGMSIILSSITKRQAKMIAIVTIFSSTSAALGPSIGGFLVVGWDWSAIFIVNFPFIILAFVMAVYILPKSKTIHIELKQIDFIGIVLFIVSITGIILFLLSLDADIRWWAFIISIVIGFTFYQIEKRNSDPFIDVKSLKNNRGVTLIYIQFLLINFVYYSNFIGLPTFLQQVRGYSESYTGLIMLTLAGVGVLITPIVGKMIDYYGSKLPMVIGAIFLLIGTGLLLSYTEKSPLLRLLITLAILGISNGFTSVSSQTLLYKNIQEEDTGSASGLFQTSRYLGAILSGSLLGLIFKRNLDYVHLHIVASVCLILCFVIFAISMMLPGNVRNSK